MFLYLFWYVWCCDHNQTQSLYTEHRLLKFRISFSNSRKLLHSVTLWNWSKVLALLYFTFCLRTQRDSKAITLSCAAMPSISKYFCFSNLTSRSVGESKLQICCSKVGPLPVSRRDLSASPLPRNTSHRKPPNHKELLFVEMSLQVFDTVGVIMWCTRRGRFLAQFKHTCIICSKKCCIQKVHSVSRFKAKYKSDMVCRVLGLKIKHSKATSHWARILPEHERFFSSHDVCRDLIFPEGFTKGLSGKLS